MAAETDGSLPNTRCASLTLARGNGSSSTETNSQVTAENEINVTKTGREGVNPQEASSPRSGQGSSAETTLTEDSSKTVATVHLNGENILREPRGRGGEEIRQMEEVSKRDKTLAAAAPKGSRKRGRRARVATVGENAVDHTVRSRLPPHQYETCLRRRATRKREAASRPKSSSSVSSSDSPNSSSSRRSIFGHSPVGSPQKKQEETSSSDENEEESNEQVGDVSLGMKLTIVGGRVIVQGLNALSDGRASPAQLTGVIQRGDVLLSVNGVSLVNMPLNQLVEGLKPLSTPLYDDSYQKTLQLHFAVGEGFSLLNKSEAQLASKASAGDATHDMFSLSQFIPRDVPMVDQLSGLPLFQSKFEDETNETTTMKPVVATPIADTVDVSELARVDSICVEKQISFDIADQLDWERRKFTSNFFTSGDGFSELLKPSVTGSAHTQPGKTDMTMTQAEMLQQGGRAMAGAKALCYAMEDVDKGKDIRSFSRWNSQISLRSRASSRRRYLLETTSTMNPSIQDDSSSVASAGSSGSKDLDEVDGDEMLLGLAAYDEIWRRQVLETLQQAAEELEDQGGEEPAVDDSPSLDTALSMELGSMLFGEQMSRILTKKKRPLVLPPEEVTSVLFDLTTNLAAIMPEQISLRGKVTDSLQITLTPLAKLENSNLDENVLLASRFVVDEALPAWLKSFHPLPWEQRRVLWPRAKSSTGDSHTISNSTLAYSEDNLTLDSDSTGFPSAPRQSKNLQEQIEDMELDVETRAETCYLVTLYFTQVLLPKVKSEVGGSMEAPKESSALQASVHFVESYGAYLKLHPCLICAAAMEAEEVISALLKMAKHDLCHKGAMKQISNANVLLLYEPDMLSAILKRLRVLRAETEAEHWQALLRLCASSFPDVRPWQVRKVCLVESKGTESALEQDALADLYYEYLCLLLHPTEGHDIARRDGALVNEWCTLSVKPSLAGFDQEVAEKRLQNFYTVSSMASSDHLLYSRDLMLILELSMSLEEIDLALDIAGEIIDSPKHSTDKQILSNVLLHLRKLSKISVNVGSPQKPQEIDVPRLRRILHLFQVMATSKSQASRESIVIADELHELLLSCRLSEEIGSGDKEFELLDIFVNNTGPRHVLEMLLRWTRAHQMPSYVIPFVHKTLLRGAQSGLHQEVSGSLLRIKDARQRATLNGQDVVVSTEAPGPMVGQLSPRGNIWGRMHLGEAVVDK